MLFLSYNQQCQNTRANWKHWLQPKQIAQWSYPFFIHHWTPSGKAAGGSDASTLRTIVHTTTRDERWTFKWKIINFMKFSKFSRPVFKLLALKFCTIAYKWHNTEITHHTHVIYTKTSWHLSKMPVNFQWKFHASKIWWNCTSLYITHSTEQLSRYSLSAVLNLLRCRWSNDISYNQPIIQLLCTLNHTLAHEW